MLDETIYTPLTFLRRYHVSVTTPVLLPAGTWEIDPSHSTVEFAVRHLMVSKVKGRFTDFSGTVTVPENPLESVVRASVDVSSIHTGDPQRDAHLRTADFFEAEKHPTMEFVSTGIRTEGDRYVLSGRLTLHGVTRHIELDVEFNGTGPGPDSRPRAGLTATGEINRRDYGIDITMPLPNGGVVVGDKVKVVLDIELVLEAQA